MELSFSTNEVTHAAVYIGDRDGKAGRWWHCAELDLWIQPPLNASVDDVVSIFAQAATDMEIQI